MAERTIPKTTKEIAVQLWYAVIGTNGEGLISQVDRLETVVTELKEAPGVAARKQLNRWKDRAIVAVVAIFLSLAGFGIYHYIENIPYQPSKTVQMDK